MTAQVSKEQWIELFQATGLDEAMMMQWHRLFEARHPAGHQSFLEWLGLPAPEIEAIRAHSRAGGV